MKTLAIMFCLAAAACGGDPQPAGAPASSFAGDWISAPAAWTVECGGGLPQAVSEPGLRWTLSDDGGGKIVFGGSCAETLDVFGTAMHAAGQTCKTSDALRGEVVTSAHTIDSDVFAATGADGMTEDRRETVVYTDGHGSFSCKMSVSRAFRRAP